MLNAFLEPVTTGFFTGDKGVGMLPMDQVIVMTTNVPVWDAFMNKNDSDAARNRIKVIDVPYTMRMSEELKIYEKFVATGTHSDKPIAPGTRELLAEFAIVSRLRNGKDDGLKIYDAHIRARVLNGEIPDGAEKKVPKLHELRAKADAEEGMDGFTIRDAKKVLTDTFMARATEGLFEADTILLLETLRHFLRTANKQDYPDDRKKLFEGFIDTLAAESRKDLVKKINSAIIDADDSACQNVFESYLEYARNYITERDMYTKDGEPVDPDTIKKHLETFEKLAGIKNGETFRQASVSWIDSEIARRALSNRGKPKDEQKDVLVRWDEYKPVADAIRAQFEIKEESRKHILKAHASSDLRTEEERRQYSRFHENMKSQGYTESMVRRMLHHLDYT
jgi:serine protein kinase